MLTKLPSTKMALPLCGRRRFAPTGIFSMRQTTCLTLLYHKFLRHSNPFREKAAAVDCIAIHGGQPSLLLGDL